MIPSCASLQVRVHCGRGGGFTPPSQNSVEFVHEATPVISWQVVSTLIYNTNIIGHGGCVPSIIKSRACAAWMSRTKAVAMAKESSKNCNKKTKRNTQKEKPSPANKSPSKKAAADAAGEAAAAAAAEAGIMEGEERDESGEESEEEPKPQEGVHVPVAQAAVERAAATELAAARERIAALERRLAGAEKEVRSISFHI